MLESREYQDETSRAAAELGQARVRLARYEAQEARIRALCRAWRLVGELHEFCTYAREDILAALDEPEAPT